MLVKVRGGTTNTTSDTVIYTGATLNTPVAAGSPVPNLAGVNRDLQRQRGHRPRHQRRQLALSSPPSSPGQGVTADNDGASSAGRPGRICLLVRGAT